MFCDSHLVGVSGLTGGLVEVVWNREDGLSEVSSDRG